MKVSRTNGQRQWHQRINPAVEDAISKLVDGWTEDPGNIKKMFLELKKYISGKNEG